MLEKLQQTDPSLYRRTDASLITFGKNYFKYYRVIFSDSQLNMEEREKITNLLKEAAKDVP